MKKPKHMEQAIFFPRAFRNEIDLWRWHYRLLFRTIFHSSSNIPIIQDVIHLWTVDFRANTRKKLMKFMDWTKINQLLYQNLQNLWELILQRRGINTVLRGEAGVWSVRETIHPRFILDPALTAIRLAFISGTVFHHFVTVTLIKPGNSTKCILGGPFK